VGVGWARRASGGVRLPAQRARFNTIWWVRAGEPATLVGDYTDLGVELGVAEAGQADQQLLARSVRRWLDDHDRWLLVLDNAVGVPDVGDA
jgi:hypothetical protein